MTVGQHDLPIITPMVAKAAHVVPEENIVLFWPEVREGCRGSKKGASIKEVAVTDGYDCMCVWILEKIIEYLI